MTVKRKSTHRSKEEKPEQQGFEIRTIPRGVKVNCLPDAIEDGVWKALPGDDVVVRRKQNGRLVDILHSVKSEKDGAVDLWDEEQHRWFIFKVEEAVKVGLVIKILRRAVQTSPPEKI